MKKFITYWTERVEYSQPRWWVLIDCLITVWASMTIIGRLINKLFDAIDRIPSKEEREQAKLERKYAEVTSDSVYTTTE